MLSLIHILWSFTTVSGVLPRSNDGVYTMSGLIELPGWRWLWKARFSCLLYTSHGTGTHHNDLFETRAIKLAFGDEAANLKINSTKSMIGHLLGAAGAVEFITCVKEIQDGFIHKTVGYETPDEEIDLNYCKNSYEEPVEYALSNSLGFGGHNASILLKAYK